MYIVNLILNVAYISKYVGKHEGSVLNMYAPSLKKRKKSIFYRTRFCRAKAAAPRQWLLSTLSRLYWSFWLSNAISRQTASQTQPCSAALRQRNFKDIHIAGKASSHSKHCLFDSRWRRPILNFAPRGKLWSQERSCSPELNSSPGGEIPCSPLHSSEQ
jgi:hypothetical protein